MRRRVVRWWRQRRLWRDMARFEEDRARQGRDGAPRSVAECMREAEIWRRAGEHSMARLLEQAADEAARG